MPSPKRAKREKIFKKYKGGIEEEDDNKPGKNWTWIEKLRRGWCEERDCPEPRGVQENLSSFCALV